MPQLTSPAGRARLPAAQGRRFERGRISDPWSVAPAELQACGKHAQQEWDPRVGNPPRPETREETPLSVLLPLSGAHSASSSVYLH